MNKIEKLKIDGNWVDNPIDLKSHILDIFNKLFTVNLNVEVNDFCFPPCQKVEL